MSNQKPPQTRGIFFWLTSGALLLALVVVMLGAYVRLSDAGLGCPDWPGCYGKVVVPASTELYPERPLEHAKAWKEMVHRYGAGGLGLLILLLFVLARRQGSTRSMRRLSGALLLLVIFQALLGMWTVTLKLQPMVVTAHLLGGFATTALLFWMWLGQRPRISPITSPGVSRLARITLIVAACQVALGGWTSANYAAPFCPDFPQCQGRWWPDMDFGAALQPELPPTAQDFEGGTLHAAARTAIHVTHRLGALLTALLAALLALRLLKAGGSYRRAGAWVALTVTAQFIIGVANVLLQFPLLLAVAHNGGAALLMLALLYAMHLVPSQVPSRQPLLPNPGPA